MAGIQLCTCLFFLLEVSLVNRVSILTSLDLAVLCIMAHHEPSAPCAPQEDSEAALTDRISDVLLNGTTHSAPGNGTHHNPSEPSTKPRDMGTFAWASVVISILASMFLFALDNTIVADIQPNIIKTLGNVDELPWISVGYALGAVALNLLMSRLACHHFSYFG